jgi:hypothetical protein
VWLFDDAGTVWRWHADTHRIGDARAVGDVFARAPNRVTAAVSNKWNAHTLLFDERTVYAYRSDAVDKYVLVDGYPKQLAPSIVITPQYAFTWRDGNQILVQVGIYDF